MTLFSLKMLNYKKYENFSLEFFDGLTGILGRNGSGKSTIFSAIIFALYGDTRGEKENIRYANAAKNATVEVELFFEIDQKTYSVIRQMRGKNLLAKAYLYDDKQNLLCEGSKEVTIEISKLINMNKEAFMHTVFASQKELSALSGLKNEDRKKIIRKLLGLEKIDKIESEIKLKIRDLKKETETIKKLLLDESDIKKIKVQNEIKNKEVDCFKKEIKKSEKEFTAKLKKLKEIDKRLKYFQKLKDEFINLKNILSLKESNLENQNTNLKKAKVRLKELLESKKIYEKNKHIIKEYKEYEEAILKAQKQKELFLKKEGLQKEQEFLRTRYKEAQNEIQHLEKSLEEKPILLKQQQEYQVISSEYNQKLSALQKEENDIKQEIAGYRSLLRDTEKKIENIKKIGKNSNCPTCTRPLLDEYDKVIASLQKNIVELNEKEILKKEKQLLEAGKQVVLYQKSKDEIEKKLKELGEKLSVLISIEDTLKKKRDEFENITRAGLKNKKELEILKDIKYDEKAHIDLLNRKKDLEDRYKELLGIVRLIEQIDHVKVEIDTIKKKILELGKEVENIKNDIKKHIYNVSDHNRTELEYKEILNQKDKIAEYLSEKKVALQKVEGEILTLLSRIQTDVEQREIYEIKIHDRNDYEKLKAFMSEFKNRINSQISPRISLYASEMYANITKGKYQHIEVNNEFDFFIYDEGVKYPLDRFSGGEVDLANLVLRIAISRTLSELNGSSGVEFLAFDEVFGSQDEERRYEIMEAFQSVKEQYRQIFLISHENEIKEMFERVVEL